MNMFEMTKLVSKHLSRNFTENENAAREGSVFRFEQKAMYTFPMEWLTLLILIVHNIGLTFSVGASTFALTFYISMLWLMER